MTLRRRSGYTLLEVLLVVALIGVLAAIAAPSLTETIARMRTTTALDVLAADLYYARMLALKSGRSVVVRFHPDPACEAKPPFRGTRRWEVAVRTAPERPARRSALPADAAGLCLETNRSDSLTFNSRGFTSPPGNRTVRARYGSHVDSLSVSVLGRVYRRW